MKADVTPLVLDVDGTFLRTDMLYESLWAALGKAPLKTIGVVARRFFDPARLKHRLAEIANLRVDLLPVNPELKALADQNKSAGRRVILASASTESLVSQLAESHELDDASFGSTETDNLKGKRKADVLVEEFGRDGFDYAGDSRADIVVWEQAENALVVGTAGGAAQRLVRRDKNVTTFPGGWSWSDLLRALRPQQWVKNILLFLPMLAAHDFTLSTLTSVLVGIVAFSAAASCIYIVNDLLDLEADRLHATKIQRPFASGAVPISVGMATSAACGLFALLLAANLNIAFFAVVAGYMCLSFAYSLKWKRLRWIDIATLAALYTIRVVGGAAAGAVFVSGFMLIFIFPVFVTLGCVKRLTELTLAKSDGRLPGRGYSREDRGDLLNMALLGVAGALLAFFFYSLSDQAQTLYPTRWVLWLAMAPMSIWMLRMVRLGYFGKQDYDPIVFALRDKRGIGLLMLTLSIMFYAAGLWQQWFGF